VLVEHELGWHENRVEMLERPLQELRPPPELRRSPEMQAAAEAARLETELTVVLPEDVHGAHEPVLVQRQEANALAEAHDIRPEERDVVVVRDVEALLREEPPERALLQAGATRQVRDSRRDVGQAPPKRDDPDAVPSDGGNHGAGTGEDAV